ncbi:hypothetical protein [Streptomyces sp. NPDC048527]|uniref:hypothetical protein n=1 Tax=Streptomyces sp. NPDC048527 TaxID=3365568 RepID=UPI003718E6E2
MASAQEWKLDNGAARVFTAHCQDISRPFILAADDQEGPTDLAAFEAGLDHASHSFLSEVNTRGHDLILVGYDGKASLAEQATTVQSAVLKAIGERQGDARLTVGGIGRGALLARYALALYEARKLDHQSALHISYNGGGALPRGAQGSPYGGRVAADSPAVQGNQRRLRRRLE